MPNLHGFFIDKNIITPPGLECYKRTLFLTQIEVLDPELGIGRFMRPVPRFEHFTEHRPEY